MQIGEIYIGRLGSVGKIVLAVQYQSRYFTKYSDLSSDLRFGYLLACSSTDDPLVAKSL